MPVDRLSIVSAVFSACTAAIATGVPIVRESNDDKEFHFQKWFAARLGEANVPATANGRNVFPDFVIGTDKIGFEVKGLATPGRFKNYDSNSQIPTGEHDGREIYYVFGRYSSVLDPKRLKVEDLVICHGDFLNADHSYVHKNANIKKFGSYGDLMIRDRKMYVAPTPFALVPRTAGSVTLIVFAREKLPDDYITVGRILTRTEVNELVTSYTFDLEKGVISTTTKPNPDPKKYEFRAWRPKAAGEDAELRLVEPGEPSERELALEDS